MGEIVGETVDPPTVQPQTTARPLSRAELSAKYGIGYRLLRKIGYGGSGSLSKAGTLEAPLAVSVRPAREGLQDDERRRDETRRARAETRRARLNASPLLKKLSSEEQAAVLAAAAMRLGKTDSQLSVRSLLHSLSNAHGAADCVNSPLGARGYLCVSRGIRELDVEALTDVLARAPKLFIVSRDDEGIAKVSLARKLNRQMDVCTCHKAFASREAKLDHILGSLPAHSELSALLARIQGRFHCLVCPGSAPSVLEIVEHCLAEPDPDHHEFARVVSACIFANADAPEADISLACLLSALERNETQFDWRRFVCVDAESEIPFGDSQVIDLDEDDFSDDDEVQEIVDLGEFPDDPVVILDA